MVRAGVESSEPSVSSVHEISRTWRPSNLDLRLPDRDRIWRRLAYPVALLTGTLLHFAPRTLMASDNCPLHAHSTPLVLPDIDVSFVGFILSV